MAQFQSQIDGDLPSSDSFSKSARQLGLDQAKTRSLQFNLSLPCVWQGPKYLCHRPLSPKVNISRKLESEVELEFKLEDTNMGYEKCQTAAPKAHPQYQYLLITTLTLRIRSKMLYLILEAKSPTSIYLLFCLILLYGHKTSWEEYSRTECGYSLLKWLNFIILSGKKYTKSS